MLNIDYPKTYDYNDLLKLRNKIADVLKTYFEINDHGELNEKFDPDFTAQEAIDKIHDIIGEI